jgi:putative sterol carrier protein
MLPEKLEKFLPACEGDAALQEFAQKRPMSLRFRITDQDLEFTLIFKEGKVRAGKGSLVYRPDLDVKTDEATFEGIMTGRVNGASAYMTGKLKFSGDTMKGMAMQKITKEMNRIWKGIG